MPKHRCTKGELEDQNLVAPVFSPSDITCPKFFGFSGEPNGFFMIF